MVASHLKDTTVYNSVSLLHGENNALHTGKEEVMIISYVFLMSMYRIYTRVTLSFALLLLFNVSKKNNFLTDISGGYYNVSQHNPKETHRTLGVSRPRS